MLAARDMIPPLKLIDGDAVWAISTVEFPAKPVP
jgi:hypothetical protein